MNNPERPAEGLGEGIHMNTKTMTLAIIAIFVATGFAAAIGSGSSDADGGSVTVTDGADRVVTIKQPVKKVAVCDSTTFDVYAATVGEGWVDKLVLVPADIDTREPEKYADIVKKYPQIRNIPKCPDLYSAAAFPDELVAASGADLAIIPASSIKYMGWTEESFKITTSTGCAVLCIDLYSDSYAPDAAEKSILAVGKAVGVEKRAQALTDFYNEQAKKVTDVIAGIPDSEKGKKVYVEIMGSSVKDYGSTTNMGVCEISAAGLKNAYTGNSYETWNTEKILAENPDIIIIAFTQYYGLKKGALLGYDSKGTTDEQLEKLAEEYKSRPGWSSLSAVKNGKVLFIYPEIGFTPSAFYSLQCLAKIAYPSYFGGLSPDANLQEYFDKYMYIENDGRWSYTPTFTSSSESSDGGNTAMIAVGVIILVVLIAGAAYYFHSKSK